MNDDDHDNAEEETLITDRCIPAEDDQSSLVRDESRIETEIESYPHSPAGFILRFFALLIDWSILAGVREAFNPIPFPSYKVYELVGNLLKSLSLEAGGTGEQVGFLSYLIGSIVMFWVAGLFYNSLFEASRFRASPGKMLFGIYVRPMKGDLCSFGQAFARNFFKAFSWLFFLVGFAIAGFGDKKQALHDILSDTYLFRYLTGAQQVNLPAMMFALVLFFIVEGAIFSSVLKPGPRSKITVSTKTASKKKIDQEARPKIYKKIDPTAHPSASLAATVGRAPDNARPTPTKAPKVYPGLLEWDGQEFPLEGFYVRVRRATVDLEKYGVFRESSNVKMVEIFLFKERIKNKERSALESLPAIEEDALEKIGKKPVVHFSFLFPNSAESCSLSKVYSGEVTFYRADEAFQGLFKDRSQKVAIDPLALTASGVFSLTCSSLNRGEKLRFTYTGESSFSGRSTKKVAWYINIAAQIKPLTVVKRIIFNQYKDVVALWNSSIGLLEVGFFSLPLKTLEKNAIVERGSFFGAGTKTPFAAVTFPLRRHLKNLNRDIVKNGYTLSFYADRSAGITLPGKLEKLSYSLESGEVPKSLNGFLKKGSRIFGRIEGERLKVYQSGTHAISWGLTFNAPVNFVN